MRLKWLAVVAALFSALAVGKAEAAPIYTFTNAGATGRVGPDQTAVNAAYGGANGTVVVTGFGIQDWTVPTSGLYHVTAAGAQGASGDPNHSGGTGAIIKGDFFFTAGQILQIAVGQMGLGFAPPQADGSNGGGGGGSFVVDALGNPLLVAGGGGGTRADVLQNGIDGQAGTAGTDGSGAAQTGGGSPTATIGLGGSVVAITWGSAGAGFFGDGANDDVFGTGGSSWANGLLGGQWGQVQGGINAQGGFGGGGAGNGDWGGGGGGGYSGGDGGRVAGGAGSFNTGLNQSALTGRLGNAGNGFVTFELDAPPPPVPEPASFLLLSMGGGLMFAGKKLRQRRTAE